jgi:molecular chaperone HscB
MRHARTLPADYFAAFGIKRRLTLDPAELQKTFYDLSRQYHPDRFANLPQSDQQFSLDFTALLNDAWRVLRDPIKRAEYVLTQEGFDVSEQRSRDVPPELLEEVFELNMMLERAPGRDELLDARRRFEAMRSEIDRKLEVLFRSYDDSEDRAALAAIRAALNRRRYIQNLMRDVEAALAQ